MALNRTTDQFLLDCYSGQGGFATGSYLTQFPRETNTKWDYRRAQATYPNYVGKVVDIYAGFLWRQTPSREAGDLYAAFVANADGAGRSLDYLLSSYQLLAMLLGTVYVIVDKPQAPAGVYGTMPYLAVRLPGQISGHVANAAGEWDSVTFSEWVDGNTIQRTFTRDRWKIEKNGAVIEQGTHNLGRVPVVRLHSKKPLLPTDSRARAWAYDLAQLNFDLYIQRSRINTLFDDQAFSILALPARDPQERERLSQLTLGTGNGLTYDPEAGGKPDFLAPPDGPAKTQMDWYAATVMEIYRAANLEFVGGVQQSGVALSFHFQEANSALATLADLCEQAEREIAGLVHAWHGQTFEGHIAYPKDFNLADLAQALALAMDATNLNLGAAFDKALKKRIARQVLGSDTAPSVLTEIDREIDSQGDPYGDRLAKQAATTESPPSGQTA